MANSPQRLVHTLSRFEIPASLFRRASRVTTLPSTKEEFQDLGGAWLRRNETALLIVPSVILPAEHNVLINPAHPDFDRLICHQEAKEFAFDHRLHTGRQ